MKVNQARVPEGFIASVENDVTIAYDPGLDVEISEVEIDVRRLLLKQEVYLRQYKMK